MWNAILKPLGCPEDESQKHLLQCKPLMEKVGLNVEAVKVEYGDIFYKKKQLNAVKLYSKLLDIREDLLSSQN